MNILFAASEVAPFIKTGGLADVAGSLPQKLAQLGHDVRVILPLYDGVAWKWREKMQYKGNWECQVAWRKSYCGIFELKQDDITYLFVDNEYYFKRAELYGHFDDGERFAFFSKAVISTPAFLDWHPDVIHANDWQSALVPIYLLEERDRCAQLSGTKSVFTIHNIEYQGRYGSDILEDVMGLNRGYLSETMLGYYGDINLMKGAINASDYVTTVSPSYAGELQHAFYAHGLEGVIAHNHFKLEGILNGIDQGLYNPETDPGLDQNFTAEKLVGKAACKWALQKELGLRADPSVPIVACISRLVRHKGFDLVVPAIHDIMGMGAQMVVLGTGEYGFEEAFLKMQTQYPGQFAARIQYSADLSTKIYAGSDIFLMPSVSEPCGLSQMIAMRYGTVPVVRETGGLKDTVIPHGLRESTGFTFANIDTQDMVWVMGQAVGLYYNDKGAWKKLQYNGMTRDFSWDGPGLEYEDIYYNVSGLLRPGEAAEVVQVEAPVEAAPVALEEPKISVKTEEAVEKKPAKKPATSAKKTTATAKKPATKTTVVKKTTTATKKTAKKPTTQAKTTTVKPEETVKSETETI